MFKKISVIMLLTALSIFTAQTVSAESRPNINVGVKAGIRASSTVMMSKPIKLEAKTGEVVVSGKVTSITTTSLSMDVIVVNKSTTTKAVSTSTISYTVNNVSTTKVFKNNATSTFSNIIVGDVVVVNGRSDVKGSTKLTAKVIHDLGTINPLRRAEDMNKSISNKIKAKKVGQGDRDGNKASSTGSNNGEKKGILKWFAELFGL